MTRRAKPVFDADQLLNEFKVYDQAVDVVSCYHWLFTAVTEMAETVLHFDRYPSVPLDGGRKVTPDFTVVFTDGAGLAGEVARLARRDESVESLCQQIQCYSELASMPGPPTHKGGQTQVPVGPVDVIFLNPVLTIKDAARRVLIERMDDPRHSFKPTRRPVLVQFSQVDDAYVYLIWTQGNGTMHRGDRTNIYGDIDPFVCRPHQFGDNKIQYGFVNDEVPALYMATRLWTRVLPTSFWGDEVTVPLSKLVAAVQEQHEGYGKTADVRRGMDVLTAAGLAKETEPGRQWLVTRRSLRRTDKDIAAAIAERIRKSDAPPPQLPARRSRKVDLNGDHPTLF